jgi:putative SbcD/Mre11-related phosphoesterase
MDRSRLELEPGLWLDARRALWIKGIAGIEHAGTLVVADLHLGYVWAHRFEGQLLPLSAREDSTERLLDLIASYRPAEVVLLGDVVHRVVPVPELRSEMRRLAIEVSARARLRIVLGNHDAQLSALLAEIGVEAETARQIQAGPHLLLHGDAPDDAERITAALRLAAPGGRVIIGHEHPALTVSDGVSTSVKCPCFLVSPDVLVLPAFSQWAAGTNAREGRFLSPFANRARFDRGIAILAGKLLPVKLSPSAKARQ